METLKESVSLIGPPPIIRDTEIGREAMDKVREELTLRSQNLERELKRAEQDYREVVAHNARLEEGNISLRQQITDASERERRNLQLIQDLEQEIRHNVRGGSEADRASVGRSETSMAAFADRADMNRLSDQVGCRSVQGSGRASSMKDTCDHRRLRHVPSPFQPRSTFRNGIGLPWIVIIHQRHWGMRIRPRATNSTTCHELDHPPSTRPPAINSTQRT
jgi:hypothetical protein